MKKHKKHAKLERPQVDDFSAFDIGIYGAPCGAIADLAIEVAGLLPSLRIGYIDADHAAFDNPGYSNRRNPVFALEVSLQEGFYSRHHSINESHQRKTIDRSIDVAIINSNHFEAKRTVLFYHPTKEKSVRKRTAQLASTVLVIDESGSLPDDIRSQLPSDAKFIQNAQEIAAYISEQHRSPALFGLVLAGGKSQRMGQDKTLLNLHGKPQFAHMTDLISASAESVFLSKRSDQQFETSYPTIEDSFLDLGPYGAMLSAFRKHPNQAWLVVAADLPMVDQAFIQELIEHRDPSRLATAFLNPATGFPDPLCTIWEPRAYEQLLYWLSQGYSCPRKVLINNDIQLVESARADKLFNLNTPEDLEEVKGLL
ncbi:NTP transferase domain-containing protein [Sanyastnella coralliicola]|uniref:NTP transferase domain-containing protein n=1 Tax=Sanyastnella coralliicola TaxID=3069118 RepID=UPI0027BADC00|nr:NTP transferase domain-containing protein [Longitalea sp. SCSIO 12813]